mmetsp:Transcript_6163/g.15802  ORF Transcript_6163/g.15802 Transcript_6163/m.15802 type:complete len:974 (-) Transcript_6163:246-3167(-)
MGSGASKADGPHTRTQTPKRAKKGGGTAGGGSDEKEAARERARNTIRNKHKPQTKKQDEAEFHATCRAVFDEADRNRNGVLDDGEFWLVLRSHKLNLNLSPGEIAEIQRLAEVDGPLPDITYQQFVPMFKSLLAKVYEQNDTDWNDWCKMKEPKTGATYYLNKRTGQIQKAKPKKFSEERVEEQTFEYIVIQDGTELCTTLNDAGVRMYMDWDSLEWKELPAAWMNKKAKRDFQRGATEVELDLNASQNSVGNGAATAAAAAAAPEEETVDPRVGEYYHPTRGLMHTYMFENTRNTRIYYDDKVNNWARMPLAWERNVDEVKAMLSEIDAILPRWKNVNEQMLTLRECNYDLQDAIIFAEINWGYKPYEKDDPGKSKLERQLTRSGLVAGGEDAVEDLGVLSNAAQSKIYTLQKQLTAAEKKVAQLERVLDEKNSKKVRSLQRQNTQLDGELEIRDRRVHDMQMESQNLMRKLAEVQQKWQDAERELLAVRADAAHAGALETELKALKGGTEASELKQKSSELERMRTENTHLKMKVVQMKAQLENPAGSRAALESFRTMHSRVVAIQKEKNDARQELAELVETHSRDLEIVTRAAMQLQDAFEGQVKELQHKYRSEVLQRKQLYNKLQELKGNIRVFLRIRKDERGPNITQYPSDSEVILPDLRGEPVMLDFDHVYGADSKQEDIFDNVKPVILSCVDGYNVCLMAYGQTGSGKTFTMTGPASNPGVNRRAIAELLRACNDETSKLQCTFKVSVVEVYNEQIYDLLAPRGKPGSKREPKKLKSGVRGVYLDNLEERTITIQEEVHQLINDADTNRTSAATSMNTDSSRSHLVIQINVDAVNQLSSVVSTGRLTLVDLAGSERVARSQVSGERLVEAAAINKSLSALGQVFQAIAQRAPHIPYRNSKLTHLLQDSLGGDSKTCLFVNCSPLKENLAETHSTLEFGQRIRKIELGPAKKHIKGLPPPPPPSHAR